MIGLILAGGRGTRLRPFTWFAPKPMLPIRGIPLLRHQIEWLSKYCDKILISCNAEHHQITDMVKSIEDHVQVFCVYENMPLGTAGAIKKHLSYYYSGGDEQFVVINGDTITDADISHLVRESRLRQSELVIGLTLDNQAGAGSIKISRTGRLTSFNYRKTQERSGLIPNLISAGVYVINGKMLNSLPIVGSFENWTRYHTHRRMHGVLITQPNSRIYGKAYFLDIGTPTRYLKAWIDAWKGKGPFADYR